jgi:hypothetical protein
VENAGVRRGVVPDAVEDRFCVLSFRSTHIRIQTQSEARGYLAIGMYDVEPHLTVNREERLRAHDLLPAPTLTHTFLTNAGGMRTYAGNSPMQRATYSFRTPPRVNSSVSSRAARADVGRMSSPDVSRSSLFTAARVRQRGQTGNTTGRGRGAL